jgi:glycosyltransferase involved in cell wall biosynthesis
MKIAIIGTRGIPNNYGGFEQFAEYLSKYLADKGHEVTVYSGHTHPYKQSVWQNVNIVHCLDPENILGTAGQFIYDLNCILHSRKQSYDLILQLGYTSSSIWSFLFPSKPLIVTNMDGLEWKRTKYSYWTRKFLTFAENWAVKRSDYLVADSIGIQSYLKKKYSVTSEFIPYGANEFLIPNDRVLLKYGLKKFEYDLLIARMEPENNIEVILDGVSQSNSENLCIVIGNYTNKFGTKLKNKFRGINKIRFLGAIYDLDILNNLRYYSNLYFHGHSVGGTNPSLLEAMASSALICAHKNIFNSAILGEDAYYFSSTLDVTETLQRVNKNALQQEKITNNLNKIKKDYNWLRINQQYEEFFKKIITRTRNNRSQS